VWADDFHHVIRRMTAGDSHGYYADFKGTAGELADTITQGWLYTGQRSAHMKGPRGTDPSHVPMYRFVVCTQNHDQVGNRARGERLHHTIAPETWRAASVILLTVPMLPLLFMGQEWAASSPFQYFTDLEPGLGRLVTEGRRREFAAFPEFSDPVRREQIPDPQATATFDNSHLRWDEHAWDVHARTLSLYRALIALRRDHPALSGSDEHRGEAVATGDDTIVIRRTDRRETFWVIAHFGGNEADVDLVAAAARLGVDLRGTRFEIVLDTEHGEFTAEPVPIDVQPAGTDARIRFSRAGALILRQT
jgi:maltooligosyltrehalose trehalohydrolase